MISYDSCYDYREIMVLVNLSKLLQLVVSVLHLPLEVPKRLEQLIDLYFGFKATSEHKVLIAVDSKYERIKEANLDEEKVETRKLILRDIIDQYSYSKFTFPVNPDRVFLLSSLTKCIFCEGSLVVVKSRKGGKKAVLYTAFGGVKAVVYVKHCTKCSASVYPSYSESLNESTVRRKYVGSDTMTYFSITSETYFD